MGVPNRPPAVGAGYFVKQTRNKMQVMKEYINQKSVFVNLTRK